MRTNTLASNSVNAPQLRRMSSERLQGSGPAFRMAPPSTSSTAILTILRPRFIHARIMALEMMLRGLGVRQDERGYHQPPARAPKVLRRIELHSAARREVKARIATRRLVSRMVVTNQRGLDDAIDLGVAVGIFKREARGDAQPFVRINWDRLYDAMVLAGHRRILCCPCREAAVENGTDDEEEWGHYLECVAADGEPHHGGKPIPVWSGTANHR